MLDCAPAVAVGHLACLWLWCVDNAPTGDLSGFTPDVVASGAGWKGDAEAFVDALVECRVRRGRFGFLERDGETMTVHDWDDYAGALIRYRQRRAETRRRSRAGSRGGAAESAEGAEPAESEATVATRKGVVAAIREGLRSREVRRPELDAAVETLLTEGFDADVVERAVKEALQASSAPPDWLAYLRCECKAKGGLKGVGVESGMSSTSDAFKRLGDMAKRMAREDKG
jgi:hypothetical protein